MVRGGGEGLTLDYDARPPKPPVSRAVETLAGGPT